MSWFTINYAFSIKSPSFNTISDFLTALSTANENSCAFLKVRQTTFCFYVAIFSFEKMKFFDILIDGWIDGEYGTVYMN